MNHEAVYRCYRQLVVGRSDSQVAMLDAVVRGDRAAEQVRGSGVFSEDEIRCATNLHPAWLAAKDKGAVSNPFDDVYQAGFELHLDWSGYFSYDKQTKSKLYRGQRNAQWANTASMFRTGKLSPELKCERLLSLAGTLADRIGLDERHAFAACQHYADVARLNGGDDEFGPISTWLLDVTWNPFIALAFATHGAVSNDIGVVAVLSRREWNATLGAVAPLDLVDLDSLLRPRQQEAGFVTSRYPELFEDYVPVRKYFHQRGREFEDDTVGASRANIYPSDDPVRDVVREWAMKEKRTGHPPAPTIALPLPEQATRPAPARQGWIGPDIFVRVGLAQFDAIDARTQGNSTFRRPDIDQLAVFHSWARVLNPVPRHGSPGIHRLLDAAGLARKNADRGYAIDIAELTWVYHTLDADWQRLLVKWIKSLWKNGKADRASLWNGTANPPDCLTRLE